MMSRPMTQLSALLYFILFLQWIPNHDAFLWKAATTTRSRLGPHVSSTRRRPLHHLKASTTTTTTTATRAQPTATMAETFCDLLAESLRTQSFTSFSLQGPKATAQDPTLVRGRLKRVQGRVVELKKKKCVQVTFKFHGATDVAKNYEEEVVVDDVIRPLLNGMSVVDSEWGLSVEAEIGTTSHTSLQGARLETLTQQVEFQAIHGKKQRLVTRKAKVQVKAPLAHDRVKQRPLAPTDAVLPALGLTDAKGRPKPGKKAKLVQAQKFVEIVSRLIVEEQQEKSGEKLRIYDMGCGRGYLTFCLHAHLMQNENNGGSVETFGIDVRPKLVKDMNELSQQLDFDGLTFLEGTIEQYMLADTKVNVNSSHDDDENVLKVWLALHACDTATDDALWSGIVQQASIIVVAPCCHKELRPQLDRSIPVPDVLRHGIFRQRWAATLTDSIRVMLLEMAGYQVQVMEFVQTADTPQNVMITAVKKRGALDPVRVGSVRQRLIGLAQSYGVEHQALATWMGETLGQSEPRTQTLNNNQMPPLS